MTTNRPVTEVSWAPDACTLPTADRPLRTAEFGQLFGGSVLGVERVNDRCARLELRPDPAVAALAADLAVRETQCCSFFQFAVIATGGRLTLEVTVPAAQTEVLAALTERARNTAPVSGTAVRS
jgi:hypothetical protein